MFGFLIGILKSIKKEQKRAEINELREKLEHFEHITPEEFVLLKKYSYEPTPIFYATYECYTEDCKRSPEERAALKKEGEDFFKTPEGQEAFDKMTGGHLRGFGKKKKE